MGRRFGDMSIEHRRKNNYDFRIPDNWEDKSGLTHEEKLQLFDKFDKLAACNIGHIYRRSVHMDPIRAEEIKQGGHILLWFLIYRFGRKLTANRVINHTRSRLRASFYTGKDYSVGLGIYDESERSCGSESRMPRGFVAESDLVDCREDLDDRMDRIKKIIASPRITQKAREAIRAIYVDGLSVKDFAKRAKIAQQTASWRVKEALRKIRSEMKARGYYD